MIVFPTSLSRHPSQSLLALLPTKRCIINVLGPKIEGKEEEEEREREAKSLV